MFKKNLLVVLISCLFLNCTFSQQNVDEKNSLPAAELKPYGRFEFDNDGNLELISSAVHFGFSFTGKECVLYAFMHAANNHGYLQYELDGVYQKRIKINGGSVQTITLTANTNGEHTIEIYKCTEATTGSIFIQKITGEDIHAIKPSTAPLIEFIGNSITCGAAADTSEVKCGQGIYVDQHNAYYAYGPRVARALHTNFILSSVSGIGIYRTWNMDNPSMPQVYEKARLVTNDTTLLDFKMYNPKIVSIALGTNDMSHGDGVHARQPFDSAVFVKDYTSFIQLVKSKYPKAKIVLLSSPMINGDDRILLQNCLTAVKQNVDALYSSDKPVALFFFKPMHGGGCGTHPSVEDHEVLAEQLIPFFKDLLK
jgi:lysophospholipase L1-like esterase